MMNENKQKNLAIEGLRGLAILLVIDSHCGFLGQGGIANCIFFVLAGFFAINSYVNRQSIHNWKDVLQFYFNKAIRILPLYYCVIVGVKMLTNYAFFTSREDFLKSIFFTKCYYHLWYVQNILILFLVTPILIKMIDFVKWVGYRIRIINKEKELWILCIICFGMSVLAHVFLGEEVISLQANDSYRLYLDNYLLGISCCYFYHAISTKKREITKSQCIILDLIGFAFLGMPFLTSYRILRKLNVKYGEIYVGWDFSYYVTIAVACLIIIVLINERGIVNKVLSSNILNKFGEVSYGMYLVHFFMVQTINLEDTIQTLIVILFISYCIAYVLHVLVEKPFILLKQKNGIKEFVSYYKKMLI